MLYRERRQEILSIIQELKNYNLINCNGGAISLRCDDKMLITTAGSGFRRWNSSLNDFIVLDLDGKIVEKTAGLGSPATPIHLYIYSNFHLCNAIIHTHSTPFSLAYSYHRMSIPATTNALDTLGDVPCIYADDIEIKKNINKYENKDIKIPEGMIQRLDVAVINTEFLIPDLKKRMLHRKDELSKHGLAFTIYKHGIFAFARNLDEAFENVVRVETSAQISILQSIVKK